MGIVGLPEPLLAAFPSGPSRSSPMQGQEPAAPSARSPHSPLAGERRNCRPGRAGARWRAELAACAIDPWLAARSPRTRPCLVMAAERDRERRPRSTRPRSPATARWRAPPSALFRHESVLARKDLLQRALEVAGLAGIGSTPWRRSLAHLERDCTLLPLADAVMVPGASAAGPVQASPLRSCDAARGRSPLGADLDHVRGGRGRAGASQSTSAPSRARPCVTPPVGMGCRCYRRGGDRQDHDAAAALVAARPQLRRRVIGLAPSWVAADELGARPDPGAGDRALAPRPALTAGPDAVHRPDHPAVLDAGTLMLVDDGDDGRDPRTWKPC